MVGVLGELVQDEPVRHLALGEHVLQTLGHVLVILVPDLNTPRYTSADKISFSNLLF